MRAIPFALFLLFPACSSPGNATASSVAPSHSAAASPVEADFQVIPLRYAIAPELAATLRDLLRAEDTTVVADERTNSLILRSSPERKAALASVVKSLDVPVTKP